MSSIFVSYSRQSHEIAGSLVADIEDLGHAVWMDKDLSGGQAWWDQILSVIRRCDVFVFLLDADGLNSTACQREFRYAAALGKPILPVLVADGISTNLLPPELSTLQFIDYMQQDRKSAFALARALAAVPPNTALPDPLPAPPEVPISYLGGLTQKLETTSTLSYEEQSALLVDLRRSLRDPKTSRDGRALLGKLRARRDLFATIAEDIDELLRPQIPPTPPPPKPPVEPTPLPEKVEPEPRREEAVLSPSPAGRSYLPPVIGAALGVTALVILYLTASAIGDLNGGLLGFLWFPLRFPLPINLSFPPGILAIAVAGGIAGAITDRDQKAILVAIAGFALGIALLLLGVKVQYGAYFGWGEMRDAFIFGGVCAAVAAKIHKRRTRTRTI